jgi:hypothetical protein
LISPLSKGMSRDDTAELQHPIRLWQRRDL